MPTTKKPDTPDNTPPPDTAPEPAAAEQATPEPEAVVDETPTALPPGRYRFTYLDTTVYPAHGVTAEPGDEHDWPDGPPNDGRWTLADPKE